MEKSEIFGVRLRKYYAARLPRRFWTSLGSPAAAIIIIMLPDSRLVSQGGSVSCMADEEQQLTVSS